MTLRSLHVGINVYPDTGSELAGCVNDALDWQELCEARGFMTDTVLNAAATKARMVESIGTAVTSGRAGDTTVITYSGHGTWVPDLDGDEGDGRDEALCPTDLVANGPLTDDELYGLFTQAAAGHQVVFISDSCHSGTVSRLLQPINPLGTTRHRKARFLAPSAFLPVEVTERAKSVDNITSFSKARQTALLIAGCRDTEYSYDAWFGTRPNGAFTYQAIRALKRWGSRKPTYRQWWESIRAVLPSEDYPQNPQLYGTEEQKRRPALG